MDLVVAYLPHVPTARLGELPRDYRDHESDLALDGGPDGLGPFRAVLAGLDRLSPDGRLVTLVADEQLDGARQALGDRSYHVERSDDDVVLTISR